MYRKREHVQHLQTAITVHVVLYACIRYYIAHRDPPTTVML